MHRVVLNLGLVGVVFVRVFSMFRTFREKALAASLLPAAYLATLPAVAQEATGMAAIDVSDAVATLENQIPSITAVATAVLGILFVVMAFKLVRRAAS